MKKEEIKLNELVIVTDQETLKNVIQNLYRCDIPLNYINDYIVVRTIDNLYIILPNRKKRIEKVLYYDDEQEGPEANLNNFITYNMYYNGSKRCEYIKCINRPLTCDKNVCEIGELRDTIQWGGCRSEHVRMLNENEIKDIDIIFNTVNEEYKKRLINYFKKNSNKISACGYWANR